MKDNFHHVQLSKKIWVFSTSVTMQLDMRKLKPLLDKLMCEGDKWNFDLEDCDHILRVETRTLTATAIIQQLEMAGYECRELEDENDFSEFIPFDFIRNSPPAPLFSKMCLYENDLAKEMGVLM